MGVIALSVILARKLSDFGSCYDLAHKIWMQRVGLDEKEKELVNDSYGAMIFYIGYVHERQGSNPRFPLYHREALRRGLNRKEFDDVLLSDVDFPKRVWKCFLSFTQPKPNKKITEGVVYEILEKMRNEQQSNLISLLRSKSLLNAFKWLRSVRGIGPKLAALFLRDIWCFIGEWENTLKDNWYCLQPTDAWIKFWSEKCWPDAEWTSNIKLNSDSAKIRFAKNLTSECFRCKIDPVSFNKGAWFVGSHFEEISRFCNIPEDMQTDMPKCVLSFDEQKVLEGIKEFNECDLRHNIFPV